ncbi:hypothetical protein [Flavobacterium sp. CS20]|jgi:hypothetical protein|uniref:hypothetical protein n=1 Tax=Flavobacterium sp. CS20 TaxID=2775246 RepID=UPI001B39D9CD|nr:hypothetical protein [Flavobacterium sp. CS20]QTY26474.1 hypothetical protein IGB25_11170 [Flavobacterium sp. CS20]
MKQFILSLSLISILTSCSVDNPSIVTVQNANVVDIVAPDTLNYQQTEIFEITYIKPTTCHTFEGFDVLGEAPELTIRTETRFEDNFNCEDTPTNTETVQFEYFVDIQQDHVFKFLSGASDSGQLQFITLNIPVNIE